MKGDFQARFCENAGVKGSCVTRLVPIIIMKKVYKILFFLTLFCSCIQRHEKVPADFSFSFSFDYDKFNSSDSTFIRHYNLRDTTIKLVLSAEEKQDIYDVMIGNNVFELPAKFENAIDVNCTVPSTSDMLSVKLDNKKQFIYYDYSCYPKKDKGASDRYLRIANMIKSIISNKKEVKRLLSSNIVSL